MSADEDNDFNLHYQSGRTKVEPRNLDAAGDDHPFGDEPKEFTADMRHLIRKVGDELYQGWDATIREYLANAETACLKVKEFVEDPEQSVYDEMIVSDSYQPRIEVEWNEREDRLTISDNGIGMAAVEVDQIFRRIGNTTARDDGTKSGNFGMGALSFVQFTGLDNAMIMTTHSRLNDDNAAYQVTLGGVEPVMGSLPDDQYGTTFQMNPKSDDFDVRDAVETYAENMRVPVRYEEIGQDGTIAFQEDYGDTALYDAYNEKHACLVEDKQKAYRAYASPDATGETLLLSMPIERNSSNDAGDYGAPFPFDIRILDESGKVIESTNGNEGLIPTPRTDYEEMLLDARDPYIIESMLNSKDVVAQEIVESDDDDRVGSFVVDDEDYEAIQSGEIRVPPNDYLPFSDLEDGDEPGEARVIFGPNKGRIITSEDEWSDMPEGRAEFYVPEDELEPFDVETGEGDLTLPEPTSDRDRLQEHEPFWEYIGQQFGDQFDETVYEIIEMIEGHNDPVEAMREIDPDELIVSPADLS